MNGEDMTAARYRLGIIWRLGRPVSHSELGRILRLGANDVGAAVRDYERGKSRITGPIAVALLMMLAGAIPPDEIPTPDD
jgi:hypothetical protein